MTRRQALIALLGGASAAVAAVAAGCAGMNDLPRLFGGSATAEDAIVYAHQAGIARGGIGFYIDFTSGTLMRCNLDGQDREALYSNGQQNAAGIRYLVSSDDEVFFGDVPSLSVKAIPRDGGEARTVVTAPTDTKLQPLPRAIVGEHLILSMNDATDNSSTLWSVKLTGEGARMLFPLPQGFYLHGIDLESRRAFYSGVNEQNQWEIRSASLEDGSDESILWTLEESTADTSTLSFALANGLIVACAGDASAASYEIFTLELDGTGKQQVHPFGSQRIDFDASGQSLFVADLDALALLAEDSATKGFSTVAQIPREGASTVLYALEADEGLCWLTTMHPDADNQAVYLTSLYNAETGELTKLY